ncbi:MAG: YifB family Mg chelatase-like AAA ATPase [Thermodesulfobacteriota bacterium]
MLARILSSATIGIDAHPILVEVDIARGLPAFSTVGLPDNAVKESKDRVKSAVKNSGYAFPARRITVNLAPADIKKEGTNFDLPLALGVLLAEGYIKCDNLDEFLFVGELSLDGSIRPVRGAISISMCARAEGRKLILPHENAVEAAVVSGVEVYGARTLSELVEFFNGERELEKAFSDPAKYFSGAGDSILDLSDVKGQEHTKRALEVAAAGGHNMIMIGPPGSGKTMLSKRLSTILPDMSLDEALEATKVHSVAGTLSVGEALVRSRPFRSPHHTISSVGLIGGGSFPKPGEVSLAHNGVLFLDEMPEFGKNVLEAMRQPLEDGCVNIVRAAMSISYPASFMLVGAMNPCPCGYLGDPGKNCNCSGAEIQRYRGRLSGPLLDRIDIHCDVPAVRFRELTDNGSSGESSGDVKARVNAARAIQAERLGRKNSAGIFSNSRMSSREIKKYCEVGADGKRLLETAVERLGLSARAYTRVLKVARTIADLEGEKSLKTAHISEAIQYRTLDRPVY